MIRAAIVGATGYAGEELIKILLKHPEVKITYICAKIDKPQKFLDIFPWAKGKCDLLCDNIDLKAIENKADIVFLALPHKTSMDFAPPLLKAGKVVIDLSADYRFEDTDVYQKWYQAEHKDKENIKNAVYGLPEIYKERIKKSKFIANPGCYPTAAILSLAPLLKNRLCETDVIIVDTKSGYSGAGRKSPNDPFWQGIKDNFKAYKVDLHQHSPEINQELSKQAGKDIKIIFVPHLLPIERGILETIYVKMGAPVHQSTSLPTLGGQQLIDLYKKFYKDAPFVRIKKEGEFPQLKDVQHTNFCDIAVKVSEDKKFIIIIAAIDNLIKGAAGQAVQNMNIIYGLKETEGLL